MCVCVYIQLHVHIYINVLLLLYSISSVSAEEFHTGVLVQQRGVTMRGIWLNLELTLEQRYYFYIIILNLFMTFCFMTVMRGLSIKVCHGIIFCFLVAQNRIWVHRSTKTCHKRAIVWCCIFSLQIR